MRQDNFSNIHGSPKSSSARLRRTIVVLCIIICVLSIVTCAILINRILERKHAAVTSSSLSSGQSDLTSSSSWPDVSLSGPAQASDTASSSLEVNPSAQTISADERAAALMALNVSVKSLLEANAGRYSMYYINLKNGETLGYNEVSPMVSASSIKIAYNTYLYKSAAEGTLSMDEEMAYNSSPYPQGDLETGTGTIQTSANGTKYNLSTLSHLSVTISDNCATNMILRRLGGIDAVNDTYMVPVSAVVNYRSAVSYTDYSGKLQSGKQRTSAADLAMYARNLYILYKESPASYQPLINDLCNTDYSWGIPDGVSSQYKVAHKVGFNPSYGSNNDVGIIFAQEDYVLCVMTESGNDSSGQAVIGELSKLVFDYITGCYS